MDTPLSTPIPGGEATRAETDDDSIQTQLEVMKPQRALEAQDRMEKEIQRRADEMFARRLAQEERRGGNVGTAAAGETQDEGAEAEASPDKGSDSPLTKFKKQRHEELRRTTAKAAGTDVEKVKKAEKKARKRAARKIRATAERHRREAEEAEFERQIADAKRRSREEVATSSQKPDSPSSEGSVGSHRRSPRDSESDDGRTLKQTKRAKRARRRARKRRRQKEHRKRRRRRKRAAIAG